MTANASKYMSLSREEFATSKSDFNELAGFPWIVGYVNRKGFYSEVGVQIKNFNAQAHIAQPKFLIGKTQAQIAQAKYKIGKVQAQIAQLFSKIKLMRK